MDCLILPWTTSGKIHPYPTFVLTKREVGALLDVVGKNPRSHWLALDFKNRRVSACDGYRCLCCGLTTAPGGATSTGVKYIPTAKIKQMAKSMKLTSVLLITKKRHEFGLLHLELPTKTAVVLAERPPSAQGTIREECGVPLTEPDASVPRVSAMDALVAELEAGGAVYQGPPIGLRPEYLATLGKVGVITAPNPARVCLGGGPMDAVLFTVDTLDKENSWTYVLGPMKTTG